MPVEQGAYDAVSYPGFAYADTHPDRLAVMGMLHGLEPAAVESCRVLEIGCNEGANLIPMAYAIPGGEFVGFDLAGVPVARGQQRIRELGLTNIRLFQADLMDAGDELGRLGYRFDYVIAHGVYAWVPEPVRDRMLTLCREQLEANGIVFISYNALPGGYVRSMVGDILRQRGTGTGDAGERVREGLELLQLVTDSRPKGDPIRVLLEREAKHLQQRDSRVIYHDELCRESRAVSFSEFIAHAAAHGLQYVSESALPPPTDPCFQPQIAAKAEAIAGGDRVAQEQILDFARMRTYRETLLCHADCRVSGDLRLDALGKLRLSSQASASAGEGAVLRVFTLPGGIRMESRDAGTVVLMERLIEAWPESVPWLRVEEMLAEAEIAMDGEFFRLLARLVVARMVELHAWAAPVSCRIAERPRASAVSCQEAAEQDNTVTLLHGTLHLRDAMVRRILLLLDGTRDRAGLMAALREGYPEVSEAKLAERVEAGLRVLEQSGVLLAEDRL
jgi:SAM-dependent methyltransferase